MISKVKGTHDFINLDLYNFIIAQAKQHLSLYHFKEIATPILESLELFNRSLGVYTDVVSKEMFTIVPHTQSSESICLRPEMTASTVRAFVENAIETVPWRVFSHGPVFRYERPQKGRCRQFHQLTIEMIGAQSVGYDVQLISMLDRFFHEKLGLSNYALVINFLGCAADRAAYKELLKTFLKAKHSELCATCVVRIESNTMRIFDCKNEHCQQQYYDAPVISNALCAACNNEWSHVQEQLSLLGVSYMHKPSLVRGLDYYNKTAFEFVSDNLGAQNAFCGGGRYDGLLAQLDPKHDQPSLGAAIGLERLILLLEPMQTQLALPLKPPLYIIMILSPAQMSLALLLADTLHASGLSVELLLDGSLKSMMRKANKMGAHSVLLLGSQEQESKTVMVKNMTSGYEERVLQIHVVDYLRSN